MTTLLKVLTYNIHKGFSTTRLRFVLHDIKTAINSLNPDLIFLQEIQGEHIKRATRIEKWPKLSQSEFLAESIWPHYAYGKNAVYRSGHHGNAILSKYPVIGWENIDISLHKRASRSILHLQLALPDSTRPIHAICIHMGLFKHERKKQLETLSTRIASHVPHNEPLIIAGDFNDWKKQAEFYLEHELNLKEVFKQLDGKHAKTYPIWHPTLTMDRVYCRGFIAQSAQCMIDLPWRKLSDHAPLYAELLLPADHRIK